MLGAAIIVFRETVEAALLIGIVAASTRGVAGRSPWIGGGILAGVLGAAVVAALTGRISAMFDGLGQEMFSAAVLSLAVIMLGWHNIWMSVHGAELASDARRVGAAVKQGSRELSTILIVIALAVLREGSESVLFLYGLMSGGESSGLSVAAGGAIGVAGGAALGWLLYAGMVRIPMKWLFSVTSALILLLAASMASQAARFLIQGDLLPSLKTPLWDTSSVLSQRSPAGAVLHAIAGYDATPAGMQVLFYVATLALILAGMFWAKRPPSHSTP
jgi:high-affinity iron transporter